MTAFSGHLEAFLNLPTLLGGSWVVLSNVRSVVMMLITPLRVLKSLLLPTQEPPSIPKP